jgi:putative ABC transport system permease protein
MLRNLFFLSLRNLQYRPTRSWLTVIGIIIGISVVIAIFFLGAGLDKAVSGLLNRFGADLIYVIPGQLADPTSRLLGKERIRTRDVEVIKDISGVSVVLPTVESKLLTGEFKGEKKLVAIQAQPWPEMKIVFQESQGYRLENGYWPDNSSEREVIIGTKLAEKTFKNPIGVGDNIVIKGKRLKVVGIFSELGEQTHDSSLFISVKGLEALTGERFDFMAVLVKAAEGVSPDELAENIKYTLLGEKGIGDFSVLTSAKAEKIAGDIIGLIEFFLSAIASVALVVGGVGIMNSMYTSVMERTSEIGTMKAIGAKNFSILLVFVFESGLMGIFGGTIGVILGVIIAKGVEIYAVEKGFSFLAVSFSPRIIISVMIFSFLVGAISGFLPARAASKLKPVDALKYE